MLFQLGALTIDVYPFNTHGYGRDTGFDFVKKDVMGAMRPSEAVGEADESMSFECRLFPEKLGGLPQLEILHQMRKSGMPQILVRGDGTNLGWFNIEKVSERSSGLDDQGVGRQIEVNISLSRSPRPPSIGAYLPTLMRMFLWA